MTKIFGDLTALYPVLEKSHLAWRCNCRCGKTKIIRDEHLKSGRSTSCGHCNYNIDHPLAYKSWDSMKQRCNNPNAPDYADYGGRGIVITPRWNRFIDFLDDMGDPPILGERYTLGRKNNDGPYCKENCEWQSNAQQANNRRSSLHPGIGQYYNGNIRKRT
jgi:hypothetical protein